MPTKATMRKVTLLFGAGASCDAGIPVMKGFVEGRLRQAASERGRSSWLEELLGDIAACCAGTHEDRTNMEWVWSRLDMAAGVGVPCVAERRAEFVKLVAHAMMPDAWCKVGECAYLTLLRKLREAVGSERLRDDSLSFLTFNYDIALDWSLTVFAREIAGRCALPRYWIGRPGESTLGQLPKLLKLHGSLNWSVCEDQMCGSGLRLMPDDPTCSGNWEKLPQCLPAEPCQYHGEDNSRKLTFLMVPPSWLKAPHGHNLRRVWGRAQVELKEAKARIVIGHSLPDTDLYFKHFLGLAVGRRAAGRKLQFLVVNCDRCDATRYAKYLCSLGCLPIGGTDGTLVKGFCSALDCIVKHVERIVAG